jgi:flavocytochrome c
VTAAAHCFWAGLASLLFSPVTPGAASVSSVSGADVIVIGGGISGLAAALEANDLGARVIVVEANSVGGGHAVKAGGFALVGTPLQEQKGYHDTPEIAVRDLLAWGEDADEGWVRRYVAASRSEVHDWLQRFGVKFSFILDTPEHSVPRFHFAGGSALNVVVPMMRAAFERPGIEVMWDTEATALKLRRGTIDGVTTRNLRDGAPRQLRARAVVIATGGWQANLDLVRKSWRRDLPPPEKLFVGAGQFARGDGIALARAAGAAFVRMDHQVTFSTGLPDPRDPTGTRALLTQNPSAIWVNSQGERFVSELASTKVADHAVLSLRPATHWLVFDEAGRRNLRVRDAVWLGNADAQETLKSSGAIRQANSIRELAGLAGLSPEALETTVSRYNELVAGGEDTDFGRFTRAKNDKFATPLAEPPFYAIQLFPLTRKSMGGIAIDEKTQVLDTHGRPVPGLFAAGEATGVAGINGNYGGEGTFLGPSVYTGRIAGQSAARPLASRTRSSENCE